MRFVRPGLVEEYTVSAEGVRQDLAVLERPKGAGGLVVRLVVTGAAVERRVYGTQLVLQKSRRKIAYSRLRASDATGRELPTRMEVAAKSDIENQESEMGLALVVEDVQAVYPVCIDPTFSEANWTALGSGIDGPVVALAVSGSDLYAAGGFTTAGGVPASGIAKWNGSRWGALGWGMNSPVLALAVSGSGRFAGGDFRTAGGKISLYVARALIGPSGPAPGYNLLTGTLFTGGGMQFSYVGDSAWGNGCTLEARQWQAAAHKSMFIRLDLLKRRDTPSRPGFIVLA